jgi:cytochrome c
MKKIFLVFAIAGVLSSCGGDSKKEEKKEATEQKTESAPAGETLSEKAMAIISKNDCATCHKIEEKVTGPAWRDVAKKYAGVDTAVQYLAGKIISGGGGVWGEIPMAPHPALSMEDAKTLAEYVMSLKQ